MKTLRVLLVLLFAALTQLTPSFAYAQVGEPSIAHRYGPNSVAGPGRYIELQIRIVNSTDTPILVSGAAITDVLDVTPGSPNECPREWWGDASYTDRPRGENEQNPPEPNYPLPSVSFAVPVVLAPGEDHIFDYLNLYMIEAAGNYCQSRSLRPVYQVNWQFQQTFGTVAGTITDGASGEPLSSATVSITGTTDTGLITEEIPVDTTGSYTSTTSFHTGTELTVSAASDGYNSSSSVITVAEGPNSVNLALEQTPIPTGTISGTVVDSDSSVPIANASIVFTGTDAAGAPVTQSVSTDTDGQFSSDVEFLAGSSLTLSISADGYIAAEIVIDSLSEGENMVNPALTAVQAEEPVQTPTPVPTETETPLPESTETAVPETPETSETPSPEPTGTTTPESTEAVTLTPDMSLTETPDPEATEATETTPPLATPIVEDAVPTSPTTGGNSAPAQPVVSGLPSTGSGGATPIGVMIGGAIASAAMIAFAIRRQEQ